jgi:hypothetical protein
MKRRKRAVISAVCVAIVLMVGYGWLSARYQRARDLQIVEQNTIKANSVKADIDRDLTVGTSKAAVDDWLRSHGMQDVMIAGSSYMVHVAHGPSVVWFCGSSDVWVELTFAEEHLVKTGVSVRGGDCL